MKGFIVVCGMLWDKHSQVVPPARVADGTDKAPACCFTRIALTNCVQTMSMNQSGEQLSWALLFWCMAQPIRNSFPSGGMQGMQPRLSCFKGMVSFLIWSGDGCGWVTKIAQISHHGGPVQCGKEKERCKGQVLPSACHVAREEPFQCKKVHAEQNPGSHRLVGLNAMWMSFGKGRTISLEFSVQTRNRFPLPLPSNAGSP